MTPAKQRSLTVALVLALVLAAVVGGGAALAQVQRNPAGHAGQSPVGPQRVTRPPVQVGPGNVQSAPPGSPEQAKAEAEEHEGPKPVNWLDFSNSDQPPYIAALINFAILAFIYVYFGKAPMAAGLKARRLDVSKQIDEAQRIKREAEARSEQYASKLADLGMELETTKVALASAGASEKARIVKEAEEKAARMEKDAALLVEQERRQMQADLQREAVQAALAAAEQLLRKGLTLADQERVAEEFLATLAPAKPDTSRAGAS